MFGTDDPGGGFCGGRADIEVWRIVTGRRLLHLGGLLGLAMVQVFAVLAIFVFIPFDEVESGPRPIAKMVWTILACVLLVPEYLLVRRIPRPPGQHSK